MAQRRAIRPWPARLVRAPLLGAALAAILSVAAALVPPAAAPAVPLLRAFDAPTALAADDLAISTRARYAVAPESGVVRVTVDMTAVNERPNRVSGGVITRYFFNAVNLGVQPEATHLRATQDGAGLRVTSAGRKGYRLVTIALRGDLYFQESTKLRLAFDLPAGTPRSASDVRVGPAFATFLAWAFGDAGTVRIEVPRAFAVDISGADMTTQPAAGAVQAFTASTSDALGWFAWVNARNDGGLTSERLDLPEGERIVVRGWPEDVKWRKRVTRILTRGVPDLLGRIGLPWPVDGPLNVLEVHTPLLEGYAGFYDPKADQITISEALDDLTIVHEASHAWFNSGLFTERWINEGLAEEYSARVLRSEGGAVAEPRPVKRSSKVAFPLGTWPAPAPIRDAQGDAREQYGYDAAWAVIRAIVDGAGEAGMRRVFHAAADRTTAYPGSGTPEAARIPNDWRRLLDLSEELGGAAGVADVLAKWVLPTGSATQLDDRATARTAYHRLVADGDGWTAPAVVRLALDGWQFDEADARITDAEAVLAQRSDIESAAAAAGLTPTGGLETAYESAATAGDLAAAASLATGTRDALTAVAAASAAAAAPRDWMIELGLSGKNPDADLAAARAAWEAGDLAGAADRATLVSGTLAVAADAGRGRATLIGGVVTGVVLLLAILLVLALRGRRSRRRRVAVAGVVATAVAAPSADGSPSTVADDRDAIGPPPEP